jgi:hypothetical protein
MKRPNGFTFEFTNAAVAEAQIKTAVRLYFEGSHPVPVYTLASAAREIVTTMGNLSEVETHRKSADQIRNIRRAAVWSKHAKQEAKHVIKLSDTAVELVLELACNDFARVTGRMPIEAQVYEAWIFAVSVEDVSEALPRIQYLCKRADQLFPGIREAATIVEQKTIALRVMERVLADPLLEMEMKRVVPPR